MIEVEKYLFDRMVEYVNSLSTFVSSVASNDLRKVSAIRTAIHTQKDDAKKFLDTLQQKSQSPASAPSGRAMAGMKKPLREISKYLTAIDTGIDNGELNLTKFRSHIRTHIKPLKEKLVDIGEKFVPTGMTDEDLQKEVKFVSQTKGHRDALRILKNAAKQNKEHGVEKGRPEIDSDPDKESRKLVQQYAKSKNKLPSSLKGRLFQLVEMPIVPFGDFRLMTPKFLRKTGIDFHYVADSFPVLEKQFLLAFDHTKATEYKGRKDALKTDGLKSRKRMAVHQTLQEQFVMDILDKINEVSNEDLILVSSHFEFNPSNGRIAFAWLLPRSQFKVFERVGDMSNFKWGFPWSREAASIL